MTTAIKRRRGTTSEHSTFTGLEGEITIDTTKDTVVVHDGSTAGGFPLAKENNPTFTGAATFTGDATFGDNDKAIFGAGSDLQIYHDGSNSYIDDAGDGWLVIRGATGGVSIEKYTGEVMAQFAADGYAQLRYDNSTKLVTTATGIDVTGIVKSTDRFETSNQTVIRSTVASGNNYLDFNAGGAAGNINIRNGSSFAFQMTISGSGNVGIGTSSPSAKLDLVLPSPAASASSGGIEITEGTKTFSISTTGSSYSYAGVGANELWYYGNSNFGAFTFGSDGAVPIKFISNGSERMRIDSSGVTTFKYNTKVYTGGYPETRLGISDSNYFNFTFDNPSDALSIGKNSSTKMTLTASGQLGIGTSSPNQKLNVSGGRSYFGANSEAYAIGVGYNGTRTAANQTYFIGATDAAAPDLQFSNSDGGEKVRITHSGNVGIGTSSPDKDFVVSNNGAEGIEFSTTDYTSNMRMLAYDRSTNAYINLRNEAAEHEFYIGGTERMRIDSSGNVLVGKTSVDVGTSGTCLRGSTSSIFTVSGSVDTQVAIFNRTSIDGTILDFRKDGTTVGSIGTLSSHPYIGNGDVGLRFIDSLDCVEPFTVSGATVRDNAIDLGRGTVRFKDLYLSGGLRADTLTFSTLAGTERMRIDSSGNVLVGRTGTSSASNEDGFVFYPSGYFLSARNGTGAQTHVLFINNADVSAATVGSIQTSASLTSYNTTSDYRLKEDVQPMVGASDRLMALKPVNFAWKVDGSRLDGFLAHEAATVVPEAVTGEKDAIDADGKPEYQGIDQAKLVPLLTAALQEAITKIEDLEARVATLEGN
jgi:hypothetical protein